MEKKKNSITFSFHDPIQLASNTKLDFTKSLNFGIDKEEEQPLLDDRDCYYKSREDYQTNQQ